MEIMTLDKNIKVFYVIADSFPAGVLDAYLKLHTVVPYSKSRNYFGISRPESGRLVYKAATEELIPGEAERLNCATLILEKGKYICLTVKNFSKEIHSISNAFLELLDHPGLDPNGFCVEWYLPGTEDVLCMVRLEQ